MELTPFEFTPEQKDFLILLFFISPHSPSLYNHPAAELTSLLLTRWKSKPCCPILSKHSGVHGQPHHRWTPAHKPPLQYVCHLSFTHDGRQTALYPDLLETEPYSRAARQLFGMSQSNANKWIHLLHPVLNQALADQELLQLVPLTIGAMLTMSPTEASAPSSLFFMMGLNGPSSVRKTQRTSKNITAARRMSHAQKPPRDQGDLSRGF